MALLKSRIEKPLFTADYNSLYDLTMETIQRREKRFGRVSNDLQPQIATNHQAHTTWEAKK